MIHLVTAALAVSGWLAAWHFRRSRNAWRDGDIEALFVGMEREELRRERDALKVKLESAVTQCKGWNKACQHVGEEAGDALTELYRVREENDRLKARNREIEANLKGIPCDPS